MHISEEQEVQQEAVEVSQTETSEEEKQETEASKTEMQEEEPASDRWREAYSDFADSLQADGTNIDNIISNIASRLSE